MPTLGQFMFRYLTLLLLVFTLVTPVAAFERILDFHSDITVHPDASMTVRETIRVNAEGRDIKRGIYRDFPTTYRDRYGNRYNVGFELVGVRRNGAGEDYHTERKSNGIRIYFGDKNRLLSHGEHEYELIYHTRRQLGFFDDHDELYWNVTGNGWEFVIESASAFVHLPGVPAEQMRAEAYTGAEGSKARHFHSQITFDGVEFATTRPLNSKEGLTIVAMWPKGYVIEPTLEDEVGYVLRDNRHLVWLLAGLAVVLVYYLVVWWKVGRDLPPGVIAPLYYPPKGYSPASMRFVRRHGYDHKTFASALVNLAVKGVVFIDEENDKFIVRKNPEAAAVELAPGEKALLDELFKFRDQLEFKQVNHAAIRKTLNAHERALKRNYEKIYFVRNSSWVVPGVLLSMLAYTIGLLNSPLSEGPPAIFMSVWLSVWSAVCYWLFNNVIAAWRNLRGAKGSAALVHALVLAGAFGFFEVMALTVFAQMVSLMVVSLLLVFIAVNVIFYHLLHADTRAGRKLLDEVEGFREYLMIAEGEELKHAGAPKKTPDLFEMYLPYAIALDVEQQWGERFASVFINSRGEGRDYQPGWYHGRHWHIHDISSFTDTMSDGLGSAIASSSTAPGSSSGSGGGGSSGGGGGGGGGGGW